MKSIQFLPPNTLRRIVILGICPATLVAAKFCRDSNIDIEVFGGQRQAEARMQDGGRVDDELASLGVMPRFVENLRTCEGSPYDDRPDGTVILSMSGPFIIHQDLIDLYENRVINAHGSPLPEWRGGGGHSWRIMAGDRRGNVCFHLVTSGIDDGDIVLERAYTFPREKRTPQEWIDYAFSQDAEVLVDLLTGLREGTMFALRKQDEEQSTYFPRIDSASQGYIDWSWSGDEIERFILAFSHPYDGAKSFVNTEVVRLFDARFLADEGFSHDFFCGLIIRGSSDSIVVAAKGGTITIPIGAIVTSAALKPGDRLFTPTDILEKALRLRPRYAPSGLKA